MPSETANEHVKQRRLTVTSEKFQKLLNRNKEEGKKDGNNDNANKGNRLNSTGDSESRFRKLTTTSAKIQKKVRKNHEEGNDRRMAITDDNFQKAVARADVRRPTNGTSMSIPGANKDLILELIQDATGGDIVPIKNPDEDCEMVTALDTDNLTKIQFQFLEAARTNRCDVLEMIIRRKGCRLDIRNNLDRTAMHLAAAQGCFEAVQLLTNAKVPIDLPDKHGMSPMYWAAHRDFVDIVMYLIHQGASVHRKTKRGYTLLHVLARSDSIKTLEALVRSKIIRTFTELDLNDYTPLMVATISGSLRATTVLSRIGVMETHLDKKKRNLFHLAVMSQCPLVLEQLCKHEEMPKLINAFDEDLWAPIHFAVDLDDCECTEILLKSKAHVNIRSKNAPYPLITASQRGNIPMMQLLLNYKAKIERANFVGNTPLHIASMANQVEAACFLLRHGANINALNKRLQTPFNAAVEQDSAEAAELLLLAGARINEVDRTAKSPLKLAALSGFVRIVDMIIKAERWRLANPVTAATLAKKYCRKPKINGEEDDDDDEDSEEVDIDINGEHEYDNPSEFLHEYVNAEAEDVSDESISISEAPTYNSEDEEEEEGRSEHDPSASTNQMKGDAAKPPLPPATNDRRPSTLHNEVEGSVFVAPLDQADSVETRTSTQQYQKAESVVSSTNSATGRAIERRQLQQMGSVARKRSSSLSERRSTTIRERAPSRAASEHAGHGTLEAAMTYSSIFQPEYRFLVCNLSYAGDYQTLFFYIAHRKLRKNEWKSLAKYWDFTEEHVEAIELQHTGDSHAYKEHGYRLLCIWMHGLSENTDPGRLLYSAMTAIGRKTEANNIQKHFYRATHGRGSRRDIISLISQ